MQMLQERVPLLELASPILVLNLSTKDIPIGTLPFLKTTSN